MSQFKVELISLTKHRVSVPDTSGQSTQNLTPEEFIAYCARVSNPSNQSNTLTMPKLLKYLMKHKHWSPFEMVSATIAIDTSRGIALYAARRQDSKNRQNSIDYLSDEVKAEWEKRQLEAWRHCFASYTWAIDNSIAKECTRIVLPFKQQDQALYVGHYSLVDALYRN